MRNFIKRSLKNFLYVSFMSVVLVSLTGLILYFYDIPKSASTIRISVNNTKADPLYNADSVQSKSQPGNTYSVLVHTKWILNEVRKSAEINLTESRLSDAIHIELSEDPNVFYVTAYSNNQNLSSNIVSNVGRVFKIQMQKVIGTNHVTIDRVNWARDNYKKQIFNQFLFRNMAYFILFFLALLGLNYIKSLRTIKISN